MMTLYNSVLLLQCRIEKLARHWDRNWFTRNTWRCR